MKQAITTAVGMAELREHDVPVISEREVLIKMKYVGICGSDIHIFHGKHPFVPPTLFPLVQGHEGTATVVEVGAKVNNFTVGDSVVIMPQLTCGNCEQCKQGRYNICKKLKVIGCQCDGLLSEYYKIAPEHILTVDAAISDTQAAMVEPLAVAVRAVRRVKDVIGKKVLVLGAGTIGNLVAQVAKAYGAHQVMISDLYKPRLDIAVRDCTVDFAVHATEHSLQDALHTHFGSDGADVIFECVGIEDTIETALLHCEKGKEVIVVGVFGEKTNVSMALVQDKEIDIKGVLMYKREDYISALDLIAQKRVNLDALLFKIIPFKEYPDVYTLINNNKEKALKVLIKMEDVI